MGYTHYWRWVKPVKQTAFNRAVALANKVLKARKGLLASGNGSGSLVIERDEVCFNGRGEDSHETFSIRNDGKDFDFCKTARKPYDDVVTAVLAIFAHELGDAISVSSDGDYDEWERGVKLACTATKTSVPNPMEPPEEEITFLVRVRGEDAWDARDVVDRALEEWAQDADVSDYGTEGVE
jgi:hypothetical protein